MNYKDINDYELLYMVSDSSDAIDILYKKYEPFIIKTINKWKGIVLKSGIDYEDLKQEAYYAFVVAVRGYKDKHDCLFYSYFNMILDSHLKNYVTSLFNNKNKIFDGAVSLYSSDDDNLQLIERLVDNNLENPYNEVEIRSFYNKLRNFIYTLDMQNASILEMYINGYKNKEISMLLDISYVNVGVSLNRIFKKFKNNMVNS